MPRDLPSMCKTVHIHSTRMEVLIDSTSNFQAQSMPGAGQALGIQQNIYK